MITIHVEASKALEHLKELNNRERRLVKAGVQEAAKILHNEVVQSAAGKRSEKVSMGASGQFLQSIQFAPYGPYSWKVFSNAPYAQWVEYGRKPGKAPPPGVLDRWVRLKLKVPPKEVRSVSYLVGQKIAKEGIKEKKHFRNSMARKKMEIINIIRKATKVK